MYPLEGKAELLEDGNRHIGATGRTGHVDHVAACMQPGDIARECRLLLGEQIVRAKLVLGERLVSHTSPVFQQKLR